MPNLGSISQFQLNHIKNEITDFNNPDCKDCYECCSMGSMLTKEEYTFLKSYLKHDGKQIYQRGIALIKKHLKQGTVLWMCPFSKNKRCTIYSFRPTICKQFHCKKELRSKDYNKEEMEKQEHYMIYDLFKNGFTGG